MICWCICWICFLCRTFKMCH